MHWAVSSRAHILESRSIPYLLGELTSLRFYRPIGLAVLAVASYYIGTELGFALTPNGSPTSAFWPPNAILLAILLLTPKRDWYIPLLAVLPLHLAFQSNIGVPMTTSLGWFVTNTGEALL